MISAEESQKFSSVALFKYRFGGSLAVVVVLAEEIHKIARSESTELNVSLGVPLGACYAQRGSVGKLFNCRIHKSREYTCSKTKASKSHLCEVFVILLDLIRPQARSRIVAS